MSSVDIEASSKKSNYRDVPIAKQRKEKLVQCATPHNDACVRIVLNSIILSVLISSSLFLDDSMAATANYLCYYFSGVL